MEEMGGSVRTQQLEEVVQPADAVFKGHSEFLLYYAVPQLYHQAAVALYLLEACPNLLCPHYFQ